MHRTATITIGALVAVGTALTGQATTSASGLVGTGDPISLADVEEISIGGIGTATVTIGSPAQLTVNGPQEAIDQLDITVDEEELVIEPAAEAVIDLAEGEELRYEITVETLSDIGIGDTARLEADGLTAELDIDLADSATASITNVDLQSLDAGVRGTALLSVTGTTAELELDVRESGAFDGTELAVGTAEVEARESARVVVNVSALLEAEARDSAIVEHVGTPAETDIEVRDAGEVRAATGTLLPASTGSVPPATPDAGSGPSAGSAPTEPVALEVSLAGRVFSPAVLEVAVGDTVTWINDDDTEHTVTSDDGAFDSGVLAEGASFSFTFDTPGEFAYHCSFHTEMQGTIIVR